jgi:hypothetical protein
MLDRISYGFRISGHSKSKRCADINLRAKSVADIATGDTNDPHSNSDGKNDAAVALDRLGR